MQKIRLRLRGAAESVEVTLDRALESSAGTFVFHCGERRLDAQLELVGEGRGFLQVAGRVLPFFTSMGKGAVTVWLRGASHTHEVAGHAARAGLSSSDATAPAGDITAVMPGTILKIDVAPGECFQAHQPLIILESMKMEMTLSSPRSGRVKEILCRVGQLVEMGALLIRVEE